MPLELPHPDRFADRHLGPREADLAGMLSTLGAGSLDELMDQTVPDAIRMRKPLDLPSAMSEQEMLAELQTIAARNEVFRSYIGMGYADCFTPPVILRNIVQNPGWYTAYTPYQAEISQGRLEALLNYQTMLTDLTGLDVANASLLDEATAAAEAMTMLFGIADQDCSRPFFVSHTCHPQTIAVIRTRAEPLGIEVVAGDHLAFDWNRKPFGVIVQYPATDGAVHDWRSIVEQAHAAGALVVAAADLLSLTLLTPPGEWGADVVVGNSQRFGVPLGYGGPHAAFFVTRQEHIRRMPGRIIGVARDAQGKPALRMTLQTREQHIRRERATSNICTAQVLLAVVAGMYAVYHGPRGLRAIAERVHTLATHLAASLKRQGITIRHADLFDTVCVEGTAPQVAGWVEAARARRMNVRIIDAQALGISLDETTGTEDVEEILAVFEKGIGSRFPVGSESLQLAAIPPADRKTTPDPVASLLRTSDYLQHPIFNRHHSETELLRYIKSLENRDFSLTHGMIPLGSCTMKLNATAEMIPITWPEFNRLHPFAPAEQTAGYRMICDQLESWLAEITGFSGISLQPNAGSQGEYAGLLVIRQFHASRGESHRDVCLIPASAHGTNPASAAMCGYRVVVVACDESGNVDIADLEAKAREHSGNLAALMVTYPSTYGVFEEGIRRVCDLIHQHGGQVYMDGANMNAQVGLCRPGDIGADVCHLNLHKTFCIPHGGGGPGMGPIGVVAHLQPFLPSHPVVPTGGEQGIGAVSAAPWGSASILLISWAYIRMMGGDGLTLATKYAILNANYVAERLAKHYPVLYRGRSGRVAHECILDTRPLKKSANVEVEDIAKRLMDYGFHAPTISFPVPGTVMIEPTESESKEELDRFVEAMLSIREEVSEIEAGKASRDDNPLKHAPHTAEVACATEWPHAYSREQAVFPASWTRSHKFWPFVSRIDAAAGDRNPVCTCPPVSDYE
ncbi:MAG: aminomethyl-transferring glycine dehydrogenase [Planctomycetales bacterium]|nr:aminomethyl-transferring glycine dehydrogenase [Planctomycetales bacterium]